MKEDKKIEEERKLEEEYSELDIEELVEIQGGVEDDNGPDKPSCGLGCFQGSVTPISNEED